jgi:hypothetical protein
MINKGNKEAGLLKYVKAIHFEPIKQLLTSNHIANAYKTICAFGQMKQGTTDFRLFTAKLNFAFKQIGMDVKINRQIWRTAIDDFIVLKSIESYRTQESRNRNEFMKGNKYDDLCLENLTGEDAIAMNPKIRLARLLERQMLLDMEKRWVSPDESSRIRKMILDIEESIYVSVKIEGFVDFNIAHNQETEDDTEDEGGEEEPQYFEIKYVEIDNEEIEQVNNLIDPYVIPQ